MSLTSQIAELQTTMNQIVELVEESRALTRKIPDSVSESSPKVKTIFEMSQDSMKKLKKAIGQAESIKRTLGY